jgi:hypothetical protein
LRKELGKNPKEIAEGPPKPKPETKSEKSENPIGSTASTVTVDEFNKKYKVGQIFTVENTEGKRFILTITQILENGKDIKATVKEIIK